MDQFVQLLRAAQGGQGLDNIAQFYGLSVQQAQKAAEAVMPAFALGIQRAIQSPEGMAQLMTLMMRGPYASLYDRPPSGPAPLNQAGNPALDALFGSPEVSKAVADHAATSTGLGVAVLKQLMPAFASLVMGGLTKSLAASGALNQMLAAMLARANGQPIPTGNPWVDTLALTMSSAGNMGRVSTGNPWIDAFAQMMAQSPWGTTSMSAAQNPWQDMIAATLSLMGSSMQQIQQMQQPAAPPPPPPPPPAPLGQWPFQDYFAQLFTQGFPPQGMMTPPGYDPKSLSQFAAFFPFQDFWGQMLDRSSGHAGGPSKPKS
ncbi:DUF937 domain-containing protein [Aquabacter sp. L1I39]|uniref:DUF937 domain-containing protein n=1 Tax=Aquabacter sp. L1I39 TaxID=2820278 RepID=UPI001ADB84BE|nr:DUF937 domain-containing protein [Aquabacter sp. L1I39]QTL01758.1 DUF937 domain-containing protein [Aquabacter sp. L1I39]